jgi:hypothetical protein
VEDQNLILRIFVVAGSAAVLMIVHRLLYRRGEGYIQLWERQRFPSMAWLRRALEKQGRLWAVYTLGHMSFGALTGLAVASVSMFLFGITVIQYAGISGISMALDLTVNGRAETMWVSALHRRFSRKKEVIEG